MQTSFTDPTTEDNQEKTDMGQSCRKNDAIPMAGKENSTNCPSPTSSTASLSKESGKSPASPTPDTTFDSSAIVSVSTEVNEKEQEPAPTREESVGGSTDVSHSVEDFERDSENVDVGKDANVTKAIDIGSVKAIDDKADSINVVKGEEEQATNNEENLEEVAEITAEIEVTKGLKQINEDKSENQSKGTTSEAHYDGERKINVTPPPPVLSTPATPISRASSRRSIGLKSAMTQQQQLLMVESGKLLEQLRKEVYKLRSQNSELKSDFRSLQENNQRLMDANNSLGLTFNNLNKHAKQVSKTNAKVQTELKKTQSMLTSERAQHATQVESLQMQQVELKDELKMKQESYIAEVHSRLHYQQVMTGIIDKVQARCKDHRLVEDLLAMSDECEL